MPSRLINRNCPIFFCNLKTGGPPGLIFFLAYPRLINNHFGNPFFYPTFFISNPIYFQLFLTFFNHHCYTSGFSWSLKISKNDYSPNDRFPIKIFIKIISLDSSQRVPPRSPCPPLIIEGSLEVKLPTIWTVEKQRWEESEEKRSEKRRCRCAKR